MAQTRIPLILDLHIPYCIQPENFLSRYYLIGSNAEKNRYLTCLGREILSYEGDLDEYEIRAVRLGGGSASVMSPDLLGKVLSLVREKLPLVPGAEVSYDALPNTIGTPSLTGIASGHPNRVELMARSDNDSELHTLNCSFRAQDIRNAIRFFRKFHLNNVGITVNYGIPGQTMQSWHNTLHACEIMQPGHITVEPLDVGGYEEAKEKGIWFSGGIESGEFPDKAARQEMYEHAAGYLTEKGYLCYGAGLFCLPGYEYRYRVLERNGASVIGMGVGAVSRFEGYYIRNLNNNTLYMKNAGDFEKLTAQIRERDTADMAQEYIYGRLGLSEGFAEAAYEELFGETAPKSLRGKLDVLIQKGWARADGGIVTLTKAGQFHYGEITGY